MEYNMEIDMNINDVLREVITFLECLREAQLPLTLESLREKLLIRSRNTLSVTTTARASSPEPYLDMKSGPRSLLLTKSEADSEEYIGMEESQKQILHPRAHVHPPQDYYETFENDSQTTTATATASASANKYPEQNDDQDEGQTLIGIYKNLSATQIRSKCYKCGPLYRKEGKKFFLLESRACWIALVGSHLLIYRSERHNRPYAIYPIRGYMARPAPNMISRDRQKSESAFEMYSPGNETLQFIARTPKDMDQWIAKVCEVGCRNESERNKAEVRKKKRQAIAESPIIDRRIKGKEVTRHRDAGKSTDKAESISNKDEVERKDATGSAPPLPARIPARRLPSLPLGKEYPLTVACKRVNAVVEDDDDDDDDEDDDDDDDDIYHRIEDLKNETRYQNMILSKKQQADASDRHDEKHDERHDKTIAYDDLGVPNEKEERNGKMEGQVQEDKSRDAFQETYDDIVTSSRIDAMSGEPKQTENNDACLVDGEEGEEFYDDVESLIPNRRFARDRAKERGQTEMSSKLQKKSFLERVLSRKESPGKSDKRQRQDKGKVSSNPSSVSATEEMPTYDDVSNLTPNQESLAKDEGEESPEYNCPPPPRPIYEVKSPMVNQSLDETEEFYDDVSAYQERSKKNHQQIILQSTRDSYTKAKEAVHNATCNAESEINDQPPPAREEIEHYQSPRSDLCRRDAAEIEANEELYEDIALWADFTARQRDITGKRENEDGKSIGSDKKAWNRFAVNRKSRVTSDFNCSTERNRRGGNEGEEIEDSPENNGAAKRNTIQKFISRMENSLAKVSARSPSSLSTGKSSAASNNS